MKTFRIAAVLLVGTLCAVITLAQSRPASNSDFDFAEKEHKDTLGMTKNLHDYPIGRDGTKGYVYGAVGAAPYDVPIGPFKTTREEALHRVFCKPFTSAVVVARLVGSTSRLSSRSTGIFTRYEFSVRSVFTESPQTAVGKTIYVVELGGIVKSNGDTLKVKKLGAPSWHNGVTYLLVLKHRDEAPADVFLFGPQIILKNHRVYPVDLAAHALAVTGEPLAQIKRRFQQSLLREPCY